MKNLDSQNPFYFGNEVIDIDFCNKVAELEELQKDIVSSINVLLYAPRRFGKTSILKKIQKTIDKNDNYKVIYFDFFTVSTIDEFIQKYFNVIVSTLENKPQKILKLFKDTLNIRPNVTMTITQNGDISYALSLTKKEQNATLEEILNLPFKYAKKFNKKVLIIFDEFQEIEQFNIEKKLSSAIQTHSRYVSYIFSGSKKSILTQIFSDKNRAFYKSVKHLHIGEILLKDWLIFIQNKFKKTNKQIQKKYIEKAFYITNGFPYYMQQLMYFIWDKTDKEVNDTIFINAISLMLERENDIYSIIWTNLTLNQKRTLKYIIKNDGKALYSNDNLTEFGINATTLKSTITALIKKDICDRKDNIYFFIDPFMKYWLENNQ